MAILSSKTTGWVGKFTFIFHSLTFELQFNIGNMLFLLMTDYF